MLFVQRGSDSEVFARLLSREREMSWKCESVWTYEGVFLL
jgi:hypothetical protein